MSYGYLGLGRRGRGGVKAAPFKLSRGQTLCVKKNKSVLYCLKEFVFCNKHEMVNLPEMLVAKPVTQRFAHGGVICFSFWFLVNYQTSLQVTLRIFLKCLEAILML